MSELALTILKALDQSPGGIINDSRETFPDVDSQHIQAAVTSLLARSMVNFKLKEQDLWALTLEGEDILSNGSHEVRLYNEVLKSMDGLKISDVGKVLGNSGKIGQQRAFRNGWVKKDGDKLVKNLDESPVDQTRQDLITIKKTELWSIMIKNCKS